MRNVQQRKELSAHLSVFLFITSPLDSARLIEGGIGQIARMTNQIKGRKLLTFITVFVRELILLNFEAIM